MKTPSPPDAKLTPMLKQYQEVKQAHPDKLILFRMGDFYETFFEDAHTASRVLNITLTSRDKNNANPVPLAGFPYHALDNYLDKLIQAGLKVAICEQTEDPKKAVGLVKREVVEIITPGTVLDHSLISGSANNYLSAIWFEEEKRKIGLANLDLSTGEFSFTETQRDDLVNELQRLQPAEIIVDGSASETWLKQLKLDHNPTLTIFDSWQFKPSEAASILKKHFQVHSLEAFDAQGKTAGATAAGAALAYVQTLYQVPLTHISSLRYYSLSSYMQLDEISRRNLELTRSIRYGERHGSLLAVLDQTQTPMGSRLIQNWLLHPLLDTNAITRRQDLIKAFLTNTAYLKDVRSSLREIGDLARLVSKLGALRANPRELIALRSYLLVLDELRQRLRAYSHPLIDALAADLDGFDALAEEIGNALRRKPPLTCTEGGFFTLGSG